jgi:nitrate reductase gamma subunit
MIQRIQSVYLLAAFIILEATAWMLYAVPDVVLDRYRMLFIVAFGVSGLASLYAIFLFKRRAAQRNVVKVIGVINVFLTLALVGALYLTGGLGRLFSSGSVNAVFNGLFVLPILAISLFYRASKAIKRDIDLIRSMDRIR